MARPAHDGHFTLFTKLQSNIMQDHFTDCDMAKETWLARFFVVAVVGLTRGLRFLCANMCIPIHGSVIACVSRAGVLTREVNNNI